MWNKLGRGFSAWMDGSLFVRAVAACLDFLRRVCAGSYIVGWFTADYNEAAAAQSRFARGAVYILNRVPRVVSAPEYWPRGLSRWAGGSWLISAAGEKLGTPIPPAGGKEGAGAIIKWLFVAAPVWGLLALTALTPFLPTMTLAALVIGVVFLMLFTRRFVADMLTLAVLAYIMVVLFAGFTSFAPVYAIRVALLSAALMFSFLAVQTGCARRGQVAFLSYAFVAAAAVTGLVGLYQLLNGQSNASWIDVSQFGETFRVSSTFGNPNVYGTYLLLAIPLCAALFFYTRKALVKFGLLCAGGLLLLNLLLSYSRGCYVALAVAALVFILLTEKRLMAFMPAAGAGAFFILPPSIIDRLTSVASAATSTADSSTRFRISIWQGALRIIKDFWFSGLGQGNEAFNTVFPMYAFNAVVAQHAHNVFLQIFVEMGIVGLIAFMVMLACFFRTMAVCHRHAADRRDRIFAAAMIAAAVGFLFQGMTDYVFYNYRVMLAFFIFMGLGSAFARTRVKTDGR